MRAALRRLGLLGAALLAAACTTTTPPTTTSAAPGAGGGLAGTRWRLEKFESSDDAQGVSQPADPAKYGLEFQPGGLLAMRLDCNRGAATWSAIPTEAGRGTLSISPGGMTRAVCPPGSWDTRIAQRIGEVQSYVIQGDRLHLALKLDSGVYTWVREP
ncbi:META domain-containing protein [Phenylobacterium sp. LjRoot219]|uniref:META domain-containing protein n=1 Tax=Phenylobacterium sp. LjRoot219 TaxID=3342283 RepID=UPI003ECDA966